MSLDLIEISPFVESRHIFIAVLAAVGLILFCSISEVISRCSRESQSVKLIKLTDAIDTLGEE